MAKHRLLSVVRLGFTSAAGVFVLAAAACTGGEDIIPDANGGSAGSAGGSVLPNGGSGPSAGSSSTPMGGMAGTTSTSGGSGPSAGSGGASAGGGGAGGGPSGGSGGSGGMAGEDLNAVVNGWNAWRYELPCASYPGGAALDDGCSQGDVCWVGTDSVSPYKDQKDITMAGDPTKVYEFELWARGVIEPKVHANCEKVSEQAEPQGGIRVCKGGADAGSGFNLWSIEITDPPQLYWMNDADNDNHRTNILNGKFKVQARGGTKVTFKFDNKNTGQINNGCPAFRKVVEGVAPYPDYYEGNFFQLDVTPGSVKVLP